MRFAEPMNLLLLFLVLLLAGFVWIAIYRKRVLLKRFGDLPLIMRNAPYISFARQAGKAAILLVGVAFLVVSLARLQFGTHMEMLKREGLDIAVALDVSNSMHAADYAPNRLFKAKQEIHGIIDRLKGDRIGLVAFAGEGFVQCPLTLDYSAAQLLLDAMDNSSVSVQGTSLTAAINTARKMFDSKESQFKVMVLLTDGEDHGGGIEDAAEEARKAGIKIYTIGIGNPAGEPIPILDRAGNQMGFRKDENGKIIISRLDEATLQKISLTTGGKYYHASPGEMELDRIFDEISGLEKKELEGTLVTRYDDRFQWPLSLAIFFIVIEFFVSERRKIKGAPDNA